MFFQKLFKSYFLVYFFKRPSKIFKKNLNKNKNSKFKVDLLYLFTPPILITMKLDQAHILLVEDNEGDILLTIDAFEESRINSKISIARNGQEALDFLFKNGNFKNSEKPDLILLDINMPILNGHEVLEKIKKDSILKKIPVIMLTTSSNQNDIDKAYENHVNSYITKPIEISDFLEAILKIEEFWLQISTLSK